MASTAKNKKGKSSHAILQITGKGPEAYKDINWKTLSDDEAISIEKEGSLAWRILSNTQTQALQQMTVEDIERTLGDILVLNNASTDLQSTVILDYYTTGFWWAKKEGFTSQHLSAFISVMNRLLENIKDKKFTLSDTILDLKRMMAGIGTDSTEISGGLDFLNIDQAMKLTNYFKNTLFQHHRLYEFMFHAQRKEEIIGTELCLQAIPPANLPYPPPLDEGLEEEIYKQYIAPPDPCEVAESEERLDSNDEQVINNMQQNVEGQSIDVVVDPLHGVTAGDVKRMFDIVSAEMFTNLQSDVSRKLRERESDIITRINKIHQVSEG